MFIQLLSKHRERLALLLKLYARIILQLQDLAAYHAYIKKVLIHQTLLLFGINYTDLQDQKVMEGIFPVIKAREPEVNQINSLRRWLDRQINKLTKHMNGLGDFEYEHSSLRNALSIYFNS